MIKIKNRFNGATICEFDVATVKEAVALAIESGANLSGANLSGANLSDANLSDASLGEKFGEIKADGLFSVGPIGSRKDTMLAFHTSTGSSSAPAVSLIHSNRSVRR